MFGTIDSAMILAILPEILLLLLAGLVLLFDALWPEEKHGNLGWLVAGGLVLILFLSLALASPGGTNELFWGGMIRHDWVGFAFKLLFIFGAAITALFAMEVEGLGQRGEFYLLLLVSTIGMNLMAASADLIMLYLAIETTSIPMYILAGFFKRDDKSTEAGFKYMLFGAMTSAIMLYGFSLLYGFTGVTGLYDLAAVIQTGSLNTGLLMLNLLLVLVGFSFKISAVPFHFWAPDVYEGAPTPVAGFLSTASKAAGFAVLMRVLVSAFPALSGQWSLLIAIIATVTMTLGNAIALAQKNIKRLLAYSSIAHAGYILVGVVAFSELGVAGVVFYLIAYLVTNLAAFGIVVAAWRTLGSDDLEAYDGLSRRSPGLALAMLVAFLSLAGMPPFGGFIAKVLVFAAAVQADYIWLAFVGVLNSIVGLYYYLVVLKRVYLYRSEQEGVPVPITRPYRIALVVLSVGIVLLGAFFAPWFAWTSGAAGGLF
ncbi:MAG: NADH-quinone oxidoreductase subunit N [Chloroflexi bacterium]|nr:NADH-quinone oxidoreductase subunit N [Chloroflexota bacterium]